MLVHVKRDELLAIAAQTAKAAPKTATSEAVLGIHVEADSRRSMLTLTATNYEIVIRASMGASVEQSGSVVISAALFPAAIASLPEQDVDLETEHPGQLTIRSGHARFRLSALSGDKYPMPELPFPDDTLPVSGLRSLARNTLFAVAEDGVPSPPMKCVRLHVGPDGLKASASNGFCIMEADGDKQCKGQIELLLPARSLKVLASLSNDSDVYEMGVTGKSLVFWSGTCSFPPGWWKGNSRIPAVFLSSSSANTPSIWMPPSLSAPLRSQSPSRKATTGSSLPLVSMRLR